jgi:hypothetical protein
MVVGMLWLHKKEVTQRRGALCSDVRDARQLGRSNCGRKECSGLQPRFYRFGPAESKQIRSALRFQLDGRISVC